MRITTKAPQNANLAQMFIKINKRHQSSLSNKNNDNKVQSFPLQNTPLPNEEPIKVQLVKNNNKKKIYSTKTVDIKTLYNNQMLLNTGNNENNENKNFNIIHRKVPSNDFQTQKNKNSMESNEYNYPNNNKVDRLKKYIVNQHK